VKRYEIKAEPTVDADIEAAFDWYEREEIGLGQALIAELADAYDRIRNNPFAYQELRSGIRRVLTHRFPYGVYFSIEENLIVVVAVLHTARDPAEWQLRI
jgi:plasmid stabilization system protein ParE